jgi:phosphate acetyltransferase
MLLPDEVYVYGDCAINPDPNAEQLAEIAIQSADSAKAFGLDPRIAMISYSTGTSGLVRMLKKLQKQLKLQNNAVLIY